MNDQDAWKKFNEQKLWPHCETAFSWIGFGCLTAAIGLWGTIIPIAWKPRRSSHYSDNDQLIHSAAGGLLDGRPHH